MTDQFTYGEPYAPFEPPFPYPPEPTALPIPPRTWNIGWIVAVVLAVILAVAFGAYLYGRKHASTPSVSGARVVAHVVFYDIATFANNGVNGQVA